MKREERPRVFTRAKIGAIASAAAWALDDEAELERDELEGRAYVFGRDDAGFPRPRHG